MRTTLPQILTLLIAISPAWAADSDAKKDLITYGSLRLGDVTKYDLVEDGSFLKLLPKDEKIKVKPEHQFVYPGTITDPKTGVKILESYAYVGNCLPNKGDVYVVYQTEQVDKKRRGRRVRAIEYSMYTASASERGIDEEQKEIRYPAKLASLKKIAKNATKTGLCREIPGKNRKMDPSVFNLRSRMSLDDLENEAEEKESAKTGESEEPKEAPNPETQKEQQDKS